MFPECKISPEAIRAYLTEVKPDAVLGSLRTASPTFSDFLNFISPAASSFLPEMRTTARAVRKMHFGNTARLYAPLYLSNICINDCAYCGFRSSFHHQSRRRLSREEILSEARIIKSYGMDSLLLVSGEDPHGMPVDFIADIVLELKKFFSYISIEIYPMQLEDYRRLYEAGVHGLTLYQETYDREIYRQLHRKGPKTDYDGRLAAVSAGANAGFYNIGIGALLGLNPEWRLEAVSLAAHGLWLKKNHWRTKVQFSFPRITRTAGEFTVPAPVSEAELEQMMLAFRLFFHNADIYISTRESHEFRNRIMACCASNISAGSQVAPGGYAEYEQRKAARDLEQFTVTDNSDVPTVIADMKELGLEPVFKDWDNCFGAAGA